MIEIIYPIDKTLIQSELSGKLIGITKRANNEIYIVNAHSSPNVMREIGRLREVSFRNSGGGSGKSYDTDEFDFLPQPFEQLIVYNPDEMEIIGGYRFLHGSKVEFKNGVPQVPMEHIFDFSEKFISKFIPNTIELGRAFIQPKYQSIRGGFKSLFALDNLWDGIGTMISLHPDTQYLIGKVTIYPQMNEKARMALIFYLQKFFPDHENLFLPKKPEIIPKSYRQKFEKMFYGENLKENFKILNAFVKKKGENIPPLIRAYIDLSASMRTFGTCIDRQFGNIHDTGIMITIDDIYEDKKKRYLGNYYAIKNMILSRKIKLTTKKVQSLF
jgi:hypothetical protein